MSDDALSVTACCRVKEGRERRKEARGSFLSVGRPLPSLPRDRPTDRPSDHEPMAAQRYFSMQERRTCSRARAHAALPSFLRGGLRMCRIVRFASAVTKNKLDGRREEREERGEEGERGEEAAELVRITKTAVRSLLEERRERGREGGRLSPARGLPGPTHARLPGFRRPLR